MRLLFIASGLSMALPIYAQTPSQPCTTGITLPTITVRPCPGGYENTYTRCYKEFFSQGLRIRTYTLTQTCLSIDCQPPPIETAPPPGFTEAVVKCNNCGSPDTQVATLTFPTESLSAYSSSGYVVVPISSAVPTQGAYQGQGLGQTGQSSSDREYHNGASPGASYRVEGKNGHESPSPNSLDGTSSDSASKSAQSGQSVQGPQGSQGQGNQEGDQSNDDFDRSHAQQTGSGNDAYAPDDGSSQAQDTGDQGITPGNTEAQPGDAARRPWSASNRPAPGGNRAPSPGQSPGSSNNSPGSPSNGASSGEPSFNQKADTSPSSDPAEGSNDTAGSQGGNTPQSSGETTPGSAGSGSASPQSNIPSQGNPASKDSIGNNGGNPSDDPVTVSSADTAEMNILACIMTTLISIYAMGLL
ncbi:uncharacterized protein QYS62_005226 [Fusarium acuminatum]|uniref:Uncharacterized protein n=1 Tax=Fusarium acuminatum TaxID=5515 RepID=A0ABZ2WTX6_9HYPO